MSTEKKESFSEAKIIQDLLRPVNFSFSYKIWMGFLTVALLVCLYAYTIQLQKGLGVTGMRDYVSWGIYISNFVFFVAASLIGMLISAVLGLSGQKWITPLTRISEIIAIAFSAVAGLVIISDMGRPDRLPYVFMYGRFSSPILWDITVVTTYVIMSTLLLYLPLLPDLLICKNNLKNIPAWQRKIYEILSLGWSDKAEQFAIIEKAIRILLILIIPVALAIHTVTSWLFASTLRVGWDSTIFGPYFVAGAFVAGVSGVIIAMYFFRRNYKLQDYITGVHFDKMARLLVLVGLVYLYFNINEYLVPAYKLKRGDAFHLHETFAGRYAPMFWCTQLLGLVIPIILLLFRKMRKPLPMLIIALFVFAGSWFKRYLIVIPTEEHPYLPIQYEPVQFHFYKPTLIEMAVTLASFILVLMIITVLSKVFPVIPVKETIQELSNEK